MTAVVHLPRGLQGSGKSTLARQLAAQGAVIVCLDQHRARVWPNCPKAWDPYAGRGLDVQAAFEAELRALWAAGRDVVVDRTNLLEEDVRRVEAIAAVYRARVVVHDLTGTPVDICIARDSARPAHTRVGADAIRDLHTRWQREVAA